MSAHYHYGAGLHGYLYQDGPSYAETRADAVSALADNYGLGRVRRAALNRHGYLELSPRSEGNEYCEVSGPCDGGCDPVDFQ